MIGTAFIYLAISSACIGVMTELRKIFQVKNGIGLVSTAVFFMISMVIASLSGLATAPMLKDSDAIILAFAYAGISAITAIICLVGSAWGKLSTISVCANLGNLLLPSLYGLIVFPEENILTVYKIIGYVFALVAVLLNFCGTSNEKSNKPSLKYNISCITVFFTQGYSLIILNLANKSGFNGIGFVNLHTAISVIIMLMIVVIGLTFSHKNSVVQVKKSLSFYGILLMVGYGTMVVLSEILALKCAGIVPLVFQSPVSFCVSIVVISLLEYIIHREKLSLGDILQICSAFVCSILFVL